MKVFCIKDHLEKAVLAAERFTGKNITLPILGNILIEVKNNEIIITATNLEYGIQITIPAKGTDGKVSVSAKILSSLLQTTKEEKVSIEEQQGNLLIKTETRDTKIKGMNTEDFPLIPKPKKQHSFSVDSTSLKNGLEKVLPSVSNSEFKPELTGVFFLISPQNIKLVSTDTFRLSEKTIFSEKKITEESFSFIIPYRVAVEISRILKDGTVLVSYGENQVMFDFEGVRVVSRVLDGSFPEYSGVIPKQFEVSVFLPKEEMAQVVRSSGIFSSKIQDVSFVFKDKKINISASNQEVGEYKTSIPADYNGKELSVSFNYRYLFDGISALDEGEFFFGANGESAPSLLRNKNDNSFLYVLMPIRLN